MKRRASAQWKGDLKSGSGSITTQSEALNALPYSFNTRFGDVKGTNPEELLGAAHAGCFTMALSFALTQQGITANALHTQATVNLDMSISAITLVELELTAEAIPGLSAEAFTAVAEEAKKNCLISKALGGVQVTLKVTYGG